MKQGWEIKKLGEVYDVRDGTHDSPKYVENGYALITSKNLKNDNLNYDNVNFITEQDYININKRSKVDVGDVLFAMIGTIGNPIVIKKEPDFAIKNVALFKVPKNQDSYFLKYYLDSGLVIEQMTKDAKGATQKFVGLGYLRSFPIPLPSLPEQQRIVSILDEAFAAIAKAKVNAEQNLKNSKELFESYLQGVFENGNWEKVKLSELAKDITDGDHMPPPKSEEGFPFITISNINKQNHQIDFSDTYKVPKQYFDKLKANRKPQKGDVLYTVTGSYGIPVLIENDFEFCFQRHIGLIRPMENVSSKWLYYWILSPQAFFQANDTATGTAQKTVSLTALRNFLLPKMTLKEQQIIIQNLDALSTETKKLEAIYQQKINDLEELKKSILQKAFNGELRSPEGA